MLMLWMSSTKPIAAVAVAQLWEQGLLDLDDPVARHIPEFAQRGKDAVTIRHVLTHTGGFRGTAGNWSARTWEETIGHICRAALEPGWVPGRTAGYHLASGWFILGEIVRRVIGLPYERYVRERIFLPIGMNDSWIGMPAEQVHAYGPRIAPMYSIRHDAFDAHFAGNLEHGITLCRPGANGRGPLRELGRFYEALLSRDLLAHRLLNAQTIEALTARHRVGAFDLTFKRTLDWCLGFIPNNNHYGLDIPYGYGPHASPRTFGHSGQQSSVAFADPEHGLVVALAFNAMPGEQKHEQRIRTVLPAIYEDLGLAGGQFT
jgi:CubicO group peptidase (beta-lactamase class C family)